MVAQLYGGLKSPSRWLVFFSEGKTETTVKKRKLVLFGGLRSGITNRTRVEKSNRSGQLRKLNSDDPVELRIDRQNTSILKHASVHT